MSLLGSLNTAVGGMNAQSAALSSISNNVANSQTVGFKETDTAFIDYLTDPANNSYTAGAVAARADYTNSQQGTITQVSNPTSLAISGAGFFAVQRQTSATTFDPLPYYTRAGDFTADNQGYLVNSEGYTLDGWPSQNAAGTEFNSAALVPIKVDKAPTPPVPTSSFTLAANIPSTPIAGTTTYSSVEQVFDADGNPQNLTLTWSQTLQDGTAITAVNQPTAANPVQPNVWALNVATATGANEGPYNVAFGATAADAGTIVSITPAGGAAAPGATGTAATVALNPNFGYGAQAITLNLGDYGGTTGVTQFAGTDYQVASQTQNGLAQGNYSSVSIQTNGNVIINYDNGTTATIAKVPLVNFSNPDGLQSHNGQTFTPTVDSGQANVVQAGTAGTGSMTVGAEEGSNVDIAEQFTQMIVAQRAYTANTKVITTANEMLQDTLNLVQG